LLAVALWAGSTFAQVSEQTTAGPVDALAAERVTTAQLIRPAGSVIELPGSRPVDMALTPDGRFVFIKDNRGVTSFESSSWKLIRSEKFPAGGGSMTGVAVTSDGKRVFATNSGSELVEFTVADDGAVIVGRRIKLPKPSVGGEAFGCGIALSKDDKTAYVCCSRGNVLAVVDLPSAEVLRTIEVGVAPYGVVLSPDGARAYVTNWGGRHARIDDLTARSAGTPAVVDERGIAASGTVCSVELASGTMTGELEVGLSPSAIVINADGTRLYVAASNSDTITEVDPRAWTVLRTLSARPDAKLPFGSLPSDLALSADSRTLYVTNAGNNAVAVMDLGANDEQLPRGFIPTGWFPGAVAIHADTMYIANIRGKGSRNARKDGATNSHRHVGTVQKLAIPQGDDLARMTAQSLADARVPQTLLALERREIIKDRAPVPVPAAPGEPSVFEHVIYIIKENRTYDQVFGDMAAGDNPKGRGKPELCIYGREITPNQHVLVDQYVLLDNYYCNGVLSADGHSWATEGATTPYLERSFGGFSRSYTFGDDPLTYSSSGFVWDHVLAAGYSFRNYGEFDDTHESPDSDFPTIWEDWKRGQAGGERKITFKFKIDVAKVKKYSCPDSPGWNMDIPDQIRADVFLKEFAEFEKNGQLPNFMVIYLPNDHTSGTGEGNPTPRALVADNDYAVGRIVEAVSRSRYWPKTVFFINEDDPQDGWDHVDGHRSICMVVSPYTKRNAVVSQFYNQASVIHTIERIFGVAASNQRYAMANLMTDCFQTTPDLTPFTALPPNISLVEMNPKKTSLGATGRYFAELSEKQDFDRVDRASEDDLNRILWYDAKGEVPYPEEWVGAHGKGLKDLGLALDPNHHEDENDQDEDHE
jgi:DNA-binding beta-propeller fold protein YncE/phospholipase C